MLRTAWVQIKQERQPPSSSLWNMGPAHNSSHTRSFARWNRISVLEAAGTAAARTCSPAGLPSVVPSLYLGAAPDGRSALRPLTGGFTEQMCRLCGAESWPSPALEAKDFSPGERLLRNVNVLVFSKRIWRTFLCPLNKWKLSSFLILRPRSSVNSWFLSLPRHIRSISRSGWLHFRNVCSILPFQVFWFCTCFWVFLSSFSWQTSPLHELWNWDFQVLGGHEQWARGREGRKTVGRKDGPGNSGAVSIATLSRTQLLSWGPQDAWRQPGSEPSCSCLRVACDAGCTSGRSENPTAPLRWRYMLLRSISGPGMAHGAPASRPGYFTETKVGTNDQVHTVCLNHGNY